MTSPQYESGLIEARRDFAARDGVRLFFMGEGAAESFSRFLINFHALSVQIVLPTERWISESARCCASLGFDTLQRTFSGMVPGGQRRLRRLLRDVRALASHSGGVEGCVAPRKEVIASLWSPGVVDFLDACDDAATGPHPFSLMAIQHEIAQVHLVYSKTMIDSARAALRSRTEECLSYLQDYLTEGSEEASALADALALFLADNPEAAVPMAARASSALSAYGRFIDDCSDVATLPFVWRLSTPER